MISWIYIICSCTSKHRTDMPLALELADYLVIGSMLVISASIGVYFRFTGGRQKTTQEFLMAGKDMAILPVAFSLMATYQSAVSVLGIPSEVYMYGTQYVVWLIGLPIGSVIAAYMFLPIFFDMDACTAYEYLEKRFGKLTRSVISLLFIIQTILYMSVVLYAPSLALNAVTGLSTWTSVITLAAVCTFYCSLGGLKAVLWTDVFQALLMYAGLIAIIAKAAIDVGSIQMAHARAYDGGRFVIGEFSFDMTIRYTFWNGLLNGLYFAVSTFGTNQAQIQRMLSVRSLKRARIALLLSVPLILFYVFLCFWDGVMIYSLFHDCDPILNNSISSQDQLLPYAALTLYRKFPGLSGLCICGVFGASLSTISSAVNSLTAVTMEDFIRPYCFCKKLTESWAAFTAKVVAILYGGVCLLFTVIVASFRGVLEASNIMFGMIAGPVLGTFMLGMFTTTSNEQGALLGLTIGFVFTAWLGFGSLHAKVEIPRLLRSIEGCPKINTTTINVFLNESTTMYSDLKFSDTITNSDVNEDKLILYKLSYLWFTLIGVLATFVVGYFCSFLIGYFSGRKPVDRKLISPVLRRFLFTHQKGKAADVTMNVNRQNGVLKDSDAHLAHQQSYSTNHSAL